MKLELKHLAAYLPYGLKLLRPDGRTILLMKGLDKDSIVVDDDGTKYCGYEFTKPILRPLSDLTSDIELFNDYDVFIPPMDFRDCLSHSYEIVERLFENHFDLFGLIDAGLAIDINTLN